MRLSLAAAALSVVGVYAADIVVLVGDGGNLTFTPPSVKANVNDRLVFQFKAKNHSVTQSTFANPCVPSGINSGFQMTPQGATQFATWAFTVDNASAPLWFHCAQTNPANHCNAGMVFAVNPTQEKSFEAFQATAKSQNGTSSAPGSGSATPAATGSTGTTGTGSGSGSAGSAGSAPAGSAGSSTSSGSVPGSTDTTGAAANNQNAAMHMSANALSLVTLAGLVAGLVL